MARDLNLSRSPQRRGQTHIPRPSADAKATKAALGNKANASQVGGLKTALSAKADALEVTEALADAIARIADLEARVAALEA